MNQITRNNDSLPRTNQLQDRLSEIETTFLGLNARRAGICHRDASRRHTTHLNVLMCNFVLVVVLIVGNFIQFNCEINRFERVSSPMKCLKSVFSSFVGFNIL